MSHLTCRKVSKQQSDKSSEEEFDHLTISSNSETGESEATSSQMQIMTDEDASTKINELNERMNNKLGFFRSFSSKEKE